MSDVFSKKKRSEIMSRVKSKNSKPELFIRSELHKMGYRFRLHDAKLLGSPDIVLKKYKTVIFINGCFWHGHHNCKYSHLPKTNKRFWKKKINKNRKRDSFVKNKLRKLGWKSITIWTCQIKKKNIIAKIDKLLARRGAASPNT